MKVYMFHYVTSNFKYHHFDKNQFEIIVKQLAETKQIISLKQLKEMQNKMEKIDDDCIMLTFDDGTVDHYKYVYPILKKYNVHGLFFICSNVIKREILDIQYIHQILSKSHVNEIYLQVQQFIEKNNLSICFEEKFCKETDNWKESYIKQLLQTILPEKYRKELLEKLIKKYKISTDFNDYYMTIDNILEMKSNGMEFGCHTNSHKRLSYLNENEQINEIKENMQLLYKYNVLDENNVVSIAYPFGNYNNTTIKILDELNFEFAFTTREENVCKGKLEIGRFDCNVLRGSL